MPKRVFHGTLLKKVKVSGFRKRSSSRSGRRILKRRRCFKKVKLAVQYQ